MAESHATSTEFDPEAQHLGSVYAKALLDAAGTEAEPAVVELEAFVNEVFDKLPNLESVLSSPRVPAEARTGMLNSAFEGKMSKTVLNFLKVVVQHGRMGSIRAIAASSRHLLNVRQGRIEVLVKTAEPLDDTTADLVRDKLSGVLKKDVILKTAVDPEVIGGIVVQVGDTVYDGSISNQLKQLRRGIVKKTAEQIRESLDRFMVAT